MIIGILGLINSGKGTIADHLVAKHNFREDSFATSVKDALAVIFLWDRALLEGDTEASRDWRNRVDPWWAKKLDIPYFTPRWAMQNFGTDVMRQHFHTDIWVSTVENRHRLNPDQPLVVSDVRFQNEIATLKKMNCVFVEIQRGPKPIWYPIALEHNQTRGIPEKCVEQRMARIKLDDYGIHQSEWDWIGTPTSFVLENNGTKDELIAKVNKLLT